MTGAIVMLVMVIVIAIVGLAYFYWAEKRGKHKQH